ncbi:MAG: hypothetical protein IPH05_04315 [Flavobacteriales bacterium]|jgi:SAM-dependent methyltransferase|nr:hypothetical protein [Flavobacteriales bacterium]MBK6551633.1 hypothetical protein [Flavobacteriales bacterium]MBK6882162.1 hypothetical protein [Flavobacteriales bacterium]MBK7101623.1 hypothetical protein [Flavobacteriales bacterium]MBK7112328.1 hypothetical protein [Flavobacteriales bacterium]
MRLFGPFALLLAVSCSTTPDQPEAVVQTPEAPAASVPSSSTAERDAWQKPQIILELMGNDLRGRKVADLKAGDGYFTFKMIEVGANVIAIDDDPANIALIEARKKELNLGDDRLQVRLVKLGETGLAPDEVEVCVMIHGFVRIPNKLEFITQVYNATQEPKPFFLVEWLNSATPIGPPMSDRMSSEKIMDEIGMVGYTDIGAYSAKIPYQVFLFASYQTEVLPMPEGVDPESLLP